MSFEKKPSWQFWITKELKSQVKIIFAVCTKNPNDQILFLFTTYWQEFHWVDFEDAQKKYLKIRIHSFIDELEIIAILE